MKETREKWRRVKWKYVRPKGHPANPKTFPLAQFLDESHASQPLVIRLAFPRTETKQSRFVWCWASTCTLLSGLPNWTLRTKKEETQAMRKLSLDDCIANVGNTQQYRPAIFEPFEDSNGNGYIVRPQVLASLVCSCCCRNFLIPFPIRSKSSAKATGPSRPLQQLSTNVTPVPSFTPHLPHPPTTTPTPTLSKKPDPLRRSCNDSETEENLDKRMEENHERDQVLEKEIDVLEEQIKKYRLEMRANAREREDIARSRKRLK